MQRFGATIVFCIVLGVVGRPMADDLAIDLADKLLEAGNYDAAVTEYKRYLFFNPSGDDVYHAHRKIGAAYKFQRRWGDAIAALKGAVAISPNDSLRNESKLSIASIYIAAGRYDLAELELIRLAAYSSNPSIRTNAQVLLGICYLYKYDWEKAGKWFHEYYSESDIDAAIDSMLANAGELDYKSPSTAKWLSTFVPGSGQIYAGAFRDGVNSLAINALTGYLLVNAIVEERGLGSVILWSVLFLRYYGGNRTNAEALAERYNESLRQQAAQQILDEISAYETER
jgi:tetratricopeptide (TPR) repeat protein